MNTKVYIIFLGYVFSSLLFSEEKSSLKASGLNEKILQNDLSITQPIRRILYTLGIACDYDLKSVVEITQKKWLRKNERWQAEEVDKKKTDFIYQLKEAGMVDQILPRKKEYDYCLVLGALYPSFVSRLQYLIDKWEKGVRFKTLVFLGNERLLDYEREKSLLLKSSNKKIREKVQLKLPQNEIEMMKFVFENENIPQQMKMVDILFINSPMELGLSFSSGVDSVIKWREEKKPSPGSCLVVSNQPFVGYQESIVRSVLGRDFAIEAIGERAADDTKISIYLDTIARWLQQEEIMNNSPKIIFHPLR